MKVITEQYVRDLLKENDLKEFHVRHDRILSPAAKDYLNQVRVRVYYDPPNGGINTSVTRSGNTLSSTRSSGGKRFVDALTGESYEEKPECMTHLFGNKLVLKDHVRIAFRGALDHLQSQIVFAQASLYKHNSKKLIDDLDNALAFVRDLLRAEVLDEPIGDLQLLGLSSAELRDQSHYPEKHFGVKAMTLPHYSMGIAYAHLNLLRSLSRQVEVSAVSAFRDGHEVSRQEIVLALNRLSSGFHIMCCRLLSDYY